MTFEQLLPQLAPWVENLVNVWPAYIIKPQFAQWQVLHILSMVVLGGSAILLNLRLIGAGLTDEPPSELARNLRPWLHVGVAGIIISGILIGMANAERLYNSDAFTVKMLALLAGVILTYGVSLPVARAEGRVSVGAKLAALAALGVWLLGLWIFATAALIPPGLWHVISAAALIVAFVTGGLLRWAYLAGLLLLVAAQYVATHVIIPADDYARLDPVNVGFAWTISGWIALAAVLHIVTSGRGEQGGPMARVLGYLGILVWVSAAAAGRWIAFA